MSIKKKIDGSPLPFLLAALAFLMLMPASVLGEDDVVVQALNDELQRSIRDLKLEDAAPPYFIKYLINEEDNCLIKAEYGSPVDCRCQKANELFTDLRVGSYDLDNSNCLTSPYGYGLQITGLPREENYATIRKAAWLLTDGAYKDAVEGLSLKDAILQAIIPDDTIKDLSKIAKLISLDQKVVSQIDTTEWKKRLEKLSAIFDNYPQFTSASLQLSTKFENRYVVNSEGSTVRQGRQVHYIYVEARAQDKIGLPVYGYDLYIVNNLADFPAQDELAAWVRKFADGVAQMVTAEPIEDYIGPVIFTSKAAGQAFGRLFVDNISDPRTPLTPDNRFTPYLANPKLIRKIGFRVLPDFLTVIDDPTISQYNGKKLLGAYRIDDDAVPAQKINLVENGKLLNYYMSATPTKKLELSNGHGRMTQNRFGGVVVVGKPGNVIVESKEHLKFDELKKQMIDLCKALELDYGLIVEKMDFTGRADPEARYTYLPDNQSALPQVIAAYKVSVKDGSLTPVRGLEFVNVSERALKDILAVGDDYEVSNLMFDMSFNNLASIVIPSVLVEEMELKKISTQPKRAAIVLSPLKR